MTQAETLKASREQKFAEWFDGRRWRVASELDGEYVAIGGTVVPAMDGTETEGIRITYDHGRFEIAQPGLFQTPLGHKGRKGYVLVEVGPDDADLPGVHRACFGRSTLDHALSEYGAIIGLPTE